MNSNSNPNSDSKPDSNTVAALSHLLSAAHSANPLDLFQPSHDAVPPVNPSQPGPVPLVPDNLQKIFPARSDERLANLPAADQETIIEWLHAGVPFRKIIELAAQPRPEGLDIKITLGSLSRFNQKTRLAERIHDAACMIQQICPQQPKTPQAAFEILAHTHTLHAMAAPDLDHAAFQQLSRYLSREQEYRLRQRSLDLREKRLAYDMQHKHYDIFKRTIEKFAEIEQIVRDKSLTPAEKFRRHCRQIFGKDAVETIDRANEKWERDHPGQNTTPDFTSTDVAVPLTREQKQKSDAEAIDIMLRRPKPEDARRH